MLQNVKNILSYFSQLFCLFSELLTFNCKCSVNHKRAKKFSSFFSLNVLFNAKMGAWKRTEVCHLVIESAFGCFSCSSTFHFNGWKKAENSKKRMQKLMGRMNAFMHETEEPFVCLTFNVTRGTCAQLRGRCFLGQEKCANYST